MPVGWVLLWKNRQTGIISILDFQTILCAFWRVTEAVTLGVWSVGEVQPGEFSKIFTSSGIVSTGSFDGCFEVAEAYVFAVY
jgi:hypothetical protein